MTPANNSEETISGINVTPLVDVVLVLLVVLWVTATYVAARSIPLDLPRAESGEASPAVLVVSVDRTESLFLDGVGISEAELGQRIDQRRGSSRDLRAVIAADGSVPHRRVVQVIDLLRRHQVRNFAINVQPTDLEPGTP
jgi:biopolymer transport protein ExbD